MNGTDVDWPKPTNGSAPLIKDAGLLSLWFDSLPNRARVLQRMSQCNLKLSATDPEIKRSDVKHGSDT